MHSNLLHVSNTCYRWLQMVSRQHMVEPIFVRPEDMVMSDLSL